MTTTDVVSALYARTALPFAVPEIGVSRLVTAHMTPDAPRALRHGDCDGDHGDLLPVEGMDLVELRLERLTLLAP